MEQSVDQDADPLRVANESFGVVVRMRGFVIVPVAVGGVGGSAGGDVVPRPAHSWTAYA